MRHGESGVTIHPLGRSDPHRFLATRGLNGLTRLWQLPPAASFSAGDEPPVTLLRCVPLDDGRLLAVAAPAGDERLRCWLVDPDRNRCDDLPAVIHPGGLTAVAGIRAGGRVHVVTAGESGTRLWTAEADGILRWVSTVPACHQDVEHVILSAVETGRMIVGTAGAEHLQLWTYDGAAFTAVVTSEDDYVTAVATGRSGDRTVVVTGDDDGVVRLIELSSGSDPKIRTVHQGKPVVAVAVMTEDRRVTAVAADRYGALSAGTTDGTAPAIESVPWQISHLRAVGNRIFGVASTPPRLLGWQLDADGRLHLDAGPLGALRGTPLHMAGTASAVAVADGGGQVLMVDVDLRVTAANLNLTADALTGVPGTGMFIMARGARLICLAAGSTAPPAGPWPAPATAAPAGRPG